MVASESSIVGRILRASTRGFACGTQSSKIDHKHDFGAFVKVPITNDDGINVIGLIYAVEIKDDMLVNELVMAEVVDSSLLRDQRENRMVPVEVSVINVGYSYSGTMIHSLPPRPPLSLSEVYLCTREEVFEFTQRCDYFRIVLSASEVPGDDLVAAALRYAAWWAYPPEQHYEFMVQCGRALTKQLSNDLRRLSHLLALIRP